MDITEKVVAFHFHPPHFALCSLLFARVLQELLSLAGECGKVEDCLMETVGDITYCYMRCSHTIIIVLTCGHQCAGVSWHRMSDRDSCENFISELEGSYKDSKYYTGQLKHSSVSFTVIF